MKKDEHFEEMLKNFFANRYEVPADTKASLRTALKTKNMQISKEFDYNISMWCLWLYGLAITCIMLSVSAIIAVGTWLFFGVVATVILVSLATIYYFVALSSMAITLVIVMVQTKKVEQLT
ncbi:MAG: hypothetical protein FWG63_07040 [Defluviitaleaceae bacterium]|nr:hypothetical protein [Defluviitaleaceae bacterium]